MPYLNARGQALMSAGGVISVDRRVLAAQGGPARWLTDDVVIAQIPDGDQHWRLAVYALAENTWRAIDMFGANALVAGGGQWAAWLAGDGFVRLSSGTRLLLAGLGDMGQDGSLAYVPTYQTGDGLKLFQTGEIITQAPVRGTTEGRTDLHLVDAWTGVYVDAQGHARGWGIADPFTAGSCYRPRLLWVRQWWLLYHTADERLLLHPLEETVGYEVATGPTHLPDGVLLTWPFVRVVWAARAGEHPDDLQIRDVDMTAPRRALRLVIVPVPPPPEPEPPAPMPELDPVPPEPDPMPDYPYPDEESWWPARIADVKALYAEAGHTINLDGTFVWLTRTAYDARAMPQDAAWRMHRAELRAALGLPPDPFP